jgi:2-C-methyl-D-erythritol 4-phosphate cytidylyltransferase
MREVAVVIAAGGRGKRMGGTLPKQFLRLGGIPILQRTVAAFHGIRAVRTILLVVPSGYVARTRSMVRRAGFTKVAGVVAGGEERQDSVLNGLAACRGRADLVLVHDAVRPLVERAVIDGVIRAAGRYGAAAAAVKTKDTVKVEARRRPGMFSHTLPREGLWSVQTPQGFRFEILWRAHRKARQAGFVGTDEASLVERIGLPVRIVRGSERNIKITTPADRRLAEFLLKRR